MQMLNRFAYNILVGRVFTRMELNENFFFIQGGLTKWEHTIFKSNKIATVIEPITDEKFNFFYRYIL